MASNGRDDFDAECGFPPTTDNAEKAALKAPLNETDTDQHVKATETEPIELPSSLTRGLSPVTTVSSFDGSMVAKWGPDAPLALLNAETGNVIVDFSTQLPRSAIVQHVGFSSDDKFFTIVLDDESSAFVWSRAKKQFISTPSSRPQKSSKICSLM
jgi:hypothetical protein